MDRQTFCLSPLLRSAQLTVSTNLLAQALLFQSLISFFSPPLPLFQVVMHPISLTPECHQPAAKSSSVFSSAVFTLSLF